VEINNEFEVPLDADGAWKILLDIERIMPCVPGAELIEIIDESTYKGKVSVKLGPVSLSFVGNAQFAELDPANKRAKVLAKGSDTKGRGGANANVVFRIEPAAAGAKVFVQTNVNLSGSVAQYGRGTGVIQGVASQLTAQFAENLRAMLAHDRAASTAAPSAPDADPASVPPSTPRPIDTTPKKAKPIGGFSLIFKVLWGMVTGVFFNKKES
jgi:uncharacterized protein